ncbi:MAG: T9SS type A sorting domain-containing protein [Bacteroidota bacterium]
MLLFHHTAAAQQRYDFQWVMGNERVNGSLEETLNTQYNFLQRPVGIDIVDSIDMIFYASRLSIADKTGHLLFTSNGCRIKDRFGELMENGDSLNPGPVHDFYCSIENDWNTYPSGFQSMLALPQPRNDSTWYLLHHDAFRDNTTGDIYTPHTLLTTINAAGNNGLGTVTTKNQVLNDLPANGQLTAGRSADLSSWWIPVAERASDRVNIYRLDSTGIELHHQQMIGLPIPDEYDAGYTARFSPDGQTYARFMPLEGIQVFDFDREAGTLSNFRFLSLGLTIDSTFWGGIEFSPSGRFLYLATSYNLYQLDLEAPTLAEGLQLISTVTPTSDFFPEFFSTPQLGPDCRLYVFCISCDWVHVVHRPDEYGQDAMVELRAIQMPEFYFRSAPTFPKYRMRALGDTSSICDHVTETIFINSTEETANVGDLPIHVFPNPVFTELKVIFPEALRDINWTVIDQLGRTIKTGKQETLPAQVALHLPFHDIPSGHYWVRMIDGAGRTWVRKVVKGRA